MHVTHVIPTLDQAYGGPVTSLCGFTRALQKQGIRNSIFAALRSGETVSDQTVATADAGVHLSTVAEAIGGQRRHPELKRRLTELLADTDIVHLHGVWESAHACSVDLCRKMDIPFVIRPCGMLSRYCLAQKRLKKWAYMQIRLKSMIRSAAAIHFTSEMEANEAPQFVTQEQQIIEPLGIHIDPSADATDNGLQIRNQYNIPSSDVLMTFLGRLHPIKGLEVLLHALKRLVADEQSVTLLICGPAENGYDRVLKDRVRELGLTHRVRFTGMIGRNEIAAAFKESDLFVLPSHHENFGVSALEALASGTPVVLSENVGIACFLRDAQVGAVAAGNDQSLAAAISQLSASPETRRHYAANCTNVARNIFSWESIADRWTRHYERLGQPGILSLDSSRAEERESRTSRRRSAA